MFKDLIVRIEEAVKLNLEYAAKGNVQGSHYTYGVVNGYIDVLESIGHKVLIIHSVDSNSCERIQYMKIDGLALVRESEINYGNYNKLLGE